MDTVPGSCSYCGSTMLVTLHMEGTIVCSSCGAVLAENLIDDSPPPPANKGEELAGPPIRRSRLPRGVRRAYRRALTRGHVVAGGRSMAYTDLKALRLASADEAMAAILSRLSSIPGLARRRPRVAVGIAIYISHRLRGRSKIAALRSAARSSGASLTALERAEKAYRREIESIIWDMAWAPGHGGERV
ncbi:TFIIB-type zinc ribbon-containing protein [Aeropyrum camini]|nr:TFIIB-type zinc ribbon-containing protein [Aeropyrum camini]